ncbi:MAG: alpha/beta hydrolase [Roseobacter sp.]
MIWIVLLLIAFLAFPFGIEARRKPMNDTERATAPGNFVSLSQGVTHFQWNGPENGRVIVCVHGLTTPSFVWRSIASGLAAAGFRVLSYDLYGRGFSDRPPGPQNAAFFRRQLHDLLADQKIDGDLTVIGYSMGGVIAADFAAAHPNSVRKLVLLAPAGMQTVGRNLAFMVKTPFFGRWLMLLRYPSLLRRGLRAEAHLPSSVPDIGALQAKELEYRGFIPAVHSCLHHMLTNPLKREHETIHQVGLPVLAIWGATDDVIDLSCKDLLATWNPDVQQEVIANAGHGLGYTHAQQVLDHVEAFTKRPD